MAKPVRVRAVRKIGVAVADSFSDAINSQPRRRTHVQSIDPATGIVFREYVSAGEAEVSEAVRRAQQAQPAWAALPLRGRSAYIEKLHNLIFRRSAEIARLISKENGKPLGEALSCEIAVVLDIARFYIRRAKKILKPRRLPHQNIALKLKHGSQIHEPYGVVAIISPWNYPFMLALGQIIPALLAGNCVVHKPSEFTPGIGALLQELIDEAGMPEDIFSVVLGDAATGAALVNAPVDKVFFTGSAITGRKVAVAASQRLIPVGLELGGSDPFIVLHDANLEHAASGAVWGRFMTCGQSCIAPKRVLVEQKVYEPFIELLIDKVKKLRMGCSEDPAADIGPMIRERQVLALLLQLEDAIAKGASVLCGGRRREDLGPWFFEPTVLVDVKASMLVMQEETFGPLLPVVPFIDVDEAIKIANATPYGLSASVWTSNVRRGRKIAMRVQAGSVLINDVMSQNGMCNAPRNGVKMSGFGYTNGAEGLLEMVRGKYVDSDAITVFRKPWWFRYTPNQAKNLDRFLSFLHAPTWRQRLAAIPGVLALLFDKERI